MSLNGANRLGSNSLTECLVFGARAGLAAAEFVDGAAPAGAAIEAQARDEEQRLRALMAKTDGTERIADLRSEMQSTMEESAGIYRAGDTLAAGGETLGRLRQHARHLKLEDRSSTFNTEFISALELDYMLELAEVILRSAVERTESRGAHQRIDFPARDDDKFLAHSLAYRADDGSARIEYLPVTITQWPPGARVYGKQ